MDDSRTRAVLGDAAMQKLQQATVAVFGVGGVGSFAAEALIRAGVGHVVLVDNDVVKPSNCNRQLVALESTIGQHKTLVMRARGMDINSHVRVDTHELFFEESTKELIFAQHFDYVVDAIDSIPSKILLICTCKERDIPIISAMGAGNKLYPERFEVTDLFRTTYDPIAKILRKQLKERGIDRLQVVCSSEQPAASRIMEEGKHVPASLSFVPSVCGLFMAGAVVRELSGVKA